MSFARRSQLSGVISDDGIRPNSSTLMLAVLPSPSTDSTRTRPDAVALAEGVAIVPPRVTRSTRRPAAGAAQFASGIEAIRAMQASHLSAGCFAAPIPYPALA